MLYWLAEWLGFPGALNLIRYLSFRSGAAVTAVDYVAAWRPAGEQAKRWVHIAVPGATHGAKHTRGLVARAICLRGIDARTPAALATGLAEDFDVALDKPARAGAPWTLHVHPPTR